MSEAIRNILLLLWVTSAINNSAYATDTNLTIEEEAKSGTATIIMGIAKNSKGDNNEVIIEQNDNNIMGEPIPEVIEPNVSSTDQGTKDINNTTKPAKTNGENSPKPLPEGDFQNTLMEANGMVYDVQAYPESDIPVMSNPSNPETIYSPNVNN